MSRLIDRLFAQPQEKLAGWVNDPESFRDTRERALRELSVAEHINVDNVAEYIFAGTDQESFGWEDYPTVAPPFKSFWMEYRQPSGIVSSNPNEMAHRGADGALSLAHAPRACGALFAVMEAKEGTPAHDAGAKWIVNLLTAVEYKKGEVLFPALWRGFGVREDGSACEGDQIALVGDSPDKPSRLTQQDKQHVAWGLQATTIPMFFAISLMHCKNVELSDEPPAPKLSKKWEKRHGRPQVTVKTLMIEPMRKNLDTEGRAGVVGIKRAMHICRGHFKDYRQSGLFGKHKDIFWWDAYVRGDGGSGEVVKDYAVGMDGET